MNDNIPTVRDARQRKLQIPVLIVTQKGKRDSNINAIAGERFKVKRKKNVSSERITIVIHLMSQRRATPLRIQ